MARCCSLQFPVEIQRDQEVSHSGEEMSYVRKTKEIKHQVFVCKAIIPPLLGDPQKEVQLQQGAWQRAPGQPQLLAQHPRVPRAGSPALHTRSRPISEPFQRLLLCLQCLPYLLPLENLYSTLRDQPRLPASHLARPQGWRLLFPPSPWKHLCSGHIVMLPGLGR